jgi:hypothetical protein
MALFNNAFQNNQVIMTPTGPQITTVTSYPTIASYPTFQNPINYTNFLNPNLMIPYKYEIDMDVDTGMNDNFFNQQKMTKYILWRVLDHHVFHDLSPVLKYLKVGDSGTVTLIKSLSEADTNDISKDSTKMIEQKADYIEKNILNQDKMRSLLKKIVNELGYRWYNLPKYEPVVVEVVGKYLRRKFKEMISGVPESKQ